jgi:hypothetical protein
VLGIFFEHQALFDHLSRRRRDRRDVSFGVRIALDNRAPRVVGRAVPPEHDRPVASAGVGNPRRHAIAKNILRKDLAGNVRRFEPDPWPTAATPRLL